VLDAYQTWEVVYQDGTPKVKRYVVDELKYHEGSAKL
jgi:hypothetical protein